LTGWRIDIKSALSEESEEIDDDELARRAVELLRAEAASNGHLEGENGFEGAEAEPEMSVEHAGAEVEAEA
jgi:hypothetical protein